MDSKVYQREVTQGEVSDMLTFQTYVFVSTLILVLFGFSSFHWYLALSGKTTL